MNRRALYEWHRTASNKCSAEKVLLFNLRHEEWMKGIFTSRNCWGKQMKKIFTKYGLVDFWTNLHNVTRHTKDEWKQVVDKAIMAVEYQKWKNNLRSGNSIKVYSQTCPARGERFELMKIGLCEKDSEFISKFRAGRLFKIRFFENVTCEICKKWDYSVEHLIMECPKFPNCRKQIIRDYIKRPPAYKRDWFREHHARDQLLITLGSRKFPVDKELHITMLSASVDCWNGFMDIYNADELSLNLL